MVEQKECNTNRKNLKKSISEIENALRTGILNGKAKRCDTLLQIKGIWKNIFQKVFDKW